MTTDRPSLPPSYWADQCRAELARVQQNACGHGVDRSKGKCNDCATETSNETSQEASA